MRRLYLRPVLVPHVDAPFRARRLAGGLLAIAGWHAALRDAPGRIKRTSIDAAGLEAWAAAAGVEDQAAGLVAAMTRPRPPIAGVPLDSPRLMGVINVTPDSFSDQADFFDTRRAIDHGFATTSNSIAAAGRARLPPSRSTRNVFVVASAPTP